MKKLEFKDVMLSLFGKTINLSGEEVPALGFEHAEGSSSPAELLNPEPVNATEVYHDDKRLDPYHCRNFYSI